MSRQPHFQTEVAGKPQAGLTYASYLRWLVQVREILWYTPESIVWQRFRHYVEHSLYPSPDSWLNGTTTCPPCTISSSTTDKKLQCLAYASGLTALFTWPGGEYPADTISFAVAQTRLPGRGWRLGFAGPVTLWFPVARPFVFEEVTVRRSVYSSPRPTLGPATSTGARASPACIGHASGFRNSDSSQIRARAVCESESGTSRIWRTLLQSGHLLVS